VMDKVTKVEMTFFIAVEGGSQAVWGGWLATVVRVQYFCFSSRGGNVIKHCQKISGGSDLVLAPREGSVTRCSGMATSAGGEALPERENGGDDVSWADANLTGPTNEENPHGQFSCYKWTENLKQ
jgi:hypothetical protein